MSRSQADDWSTHDGFCPYVLRCKSCISVVGTDVLFSRHVGMRILVTLLLDTLPMLGNVLLLCFFVFFIFGIVGVQLWAGLLRNRCFLGADIRT